MRAIPLLLLLHLASVTVWVGGMFFAYLCLRPVAAEQLAPPERLRLWCAVLARFFTWVWLAVCLIPASGLATFALIGFANAPMHWHLMLLVGCVMIAIFVAVYFLPYAQLREAVRVEDWKGGGAALGKIRRLVGVNLVLGLLTIGLATAGRLLG